MEYQALQFSWVTLSGEKLPAPAVNTSYKAANKNLSIKSEWMTPAEALQMVVRIKHKLLSENAQNFSLFNSAKRRKIWDEIVACEQCLRWMYYRSA